MSEQLDPAGNCVVVTGAASGIGRSLALQLADAGANVAIADIDADGLDETAKHLESRGVKVFSRAVDMTDFAAVDAFAEEVFDFADGTLAFVFANAGIHGLTPAIDPDLKIFDNVVKVNLMGPVHMTKAFVPRLMGLDKPAQLVITGSQASFLAAPGMSPYVATKHALWGYVDALRIELAMAQSKVGASLVAPSRVNTALTQARVESYREEGGDKAAEDYVASMVGPEAIAEVIIREAMKREFWIIPSHEPTLDMFKARADAIIEAMPAGAITLG